MEDHEVQCPTCDRVQDEAEAFLGRLGFLRHFRCRYCGAMFHDAVDNRERGEQIPEGDDELSRLASYYRPDEGGEAG